MIPMEEVMITVEEMTAETMVETMVVMTGDRGNTYLQKESQSLLNS